jgi:SPP1 family predicted phage head-tail adaptor
MAYTSGLLKHRVTILNRTEAQQGKFGLDSAGVEFEPAGTVWASVDWAKGKGAMNAGALDVYGVVMIRMRWNPIVNERSWILYGDKLYQIVGETFHADRQENTIQMTAIELANQQVNIVPTVPENALYDADGILLLDADGVYLTADYN